MLLAILLSRSRGGIVSLGVGLIFMLILATRQQLLTRTNRFRLLTALTAGIIVFGVWFGWQSLGRRFSDFSKTPTRLKVWQDTTRIISDFPLLGTGLGTFSLVFPSYRSFASNYDFTHAENDYLQAGAESGIWGIICLAGAGYFLLRLILRATVSRRPSHILEFTPRFQIGHTALLIGAAGGAAALAAHGFFNFNFHIPSNFLIFCALAGIAAGECGENSYEPG